MTSPSAPASVREVRYVASDDFVPLLDQFDCSLLVFTDHTGAIAAHEMSFVGDRLGPASTRFSCLATLDDRCHRHGRPTPPPPSGWCPR